MIRSAWPAPGCYVNNKCRLMIKLTCSRLMAISVLLMMAVPLRADISEMVELPEHIEEHQWQEQNETLPELPKPHNLIPLQVVSRGYDNYRYAIDSASLSIGEHDGVRRFTVVIQSSSGVRNLRHEGIRCETGEYKTYAYAVGDGDFRLQKTAKWRAIEKEGSGRYRYDLFEEYFCVHYETSTNVSEIIRNLRYPPEQSIGVFE